MGWFALRQEKQDSYTVHCIHVYLYLYIYLSVRVKQAHNRDHTGWNVGKTDFYLKCIFKTLFWFQWFILPQSHDPLCGTQSEHFMVRFFLITAFPPLNDKIRYFL